MGACTPTHAHIHACTRTPLCTHLCTHPILSSAPSFHPQSERGTAGPQGLLWPARGLADAVGGLVSAPGLSCSSISARQGCAGLPGAHPLPNTRSSAGEAWLWEGSGPLVPDPGPVLWSPAPTPRRAHPPPGTQGLTNIVRASSLVGKGGACPSVGCFSVPPLHSWSSGEATSMLLPPMPPVIEPLKWRLIFQSV